MMIPMMLTTGVFFSGQNQGSSASYLPYAKILIAQFRLLLFFHWENTDGRRR